MPVQHIGDAEVVIFRDDNAGFGVGDAHHLGVRERRASGVVLDMCRVVPAAHQVGGKPARELLINQEACHLRGSGDDSLQTSGRIESCVLEYGE